MLHFKKGLRQYLSDIIANALLIYSFKTCNIFAHLSSFFPPNVSHTMASKGGKSGANRQASFLTFVTGVASCDSGGLADDTSPFGGGLSCEASPPHLWHCGPPLGFGDGSFGCPGRIESKSPAWAAISLICCRRLYREKKNVTQVRVHTPP